MSDLRVKRFIPGIELKRPCNVGRYDAILCGALCLMCGPKIRIKCKEPMKVMKVVDTGLQIRKSTLKCDGWGGHIIQSQEMFVAVCKGKRHISGKPHVVCSICIENYHVNKDHMDPNYLIRREYYEYKRKKNKK